MNETWCRVPGALACLLAVLITAACGQADPVRITAVTPVATDLQSPRPSPHDSFPVQAAARASPTPLPDPAVPSPTAVPAPSAAPSPVSPPSPSAAPSASPTPSGCTAETARARVRPSVVQVINERGAGRVSVGSGYAIGGGRIITNEHVVNGAVTLLVVLPDGRRLPARVFRTDEGRDLALLDVPGAALPPVRFGGTVPAAGQRLFALGFPQASAPAQEPTLTSGTLLGVLVVGGVTFLQTDVPASVGNSGGPLLTPCGEVVGTISSGAPGMSGITFAVAGREVEALLTGAPALLPGGATPRPAPAPAPAPTSTPTATARPSPATAPTSTPLPHGRTTPTP